MTSYNSHTTQLKVPRTKELAKSRDCFMYVDFTQTSLFELAFFFFFFFFVPFSETSLSSLSSVMYGNYPAAQETFYMVAVLLVDVPSFEKRIQLLTSSASSSSSQTEAGKRKRDTRSPSVQDEY